MTTYMSRRLNILCIMFSIITLFDLITNNNSGCLINCINYYQVYHRQHLNGLDYEWHPGVSYKQYKLLSSLSPTTIWTDLITSDNLTPTRLWTDLITSNTSRCLINSINYYQVYHRQDFERTWLRITPRGDL
jgi:hypothetical protein